MHSVVRAMSARSKHTSPAAFKHCAHTRVTLMTAHDTRHDTRHTTDTRHTQHEKKQSSYGRQGLEGFVDYVGVGVAREQMEEHVPDAGHQAVQAPLRRAGKWVDSRACQPQRTHQTRHNTTPRNTTRAYAPQARATHLDTVAGSGSYGGRRPAWSVLSSAVSSVDFLFRFCASV
jgi:hypothetical protein